MLVRFGFVAMSVLLENASPSRAVTYKNYRQLAESDPAAALDRVRQAARENLANSLRLLRHCRAYNVAVYRFSSKIVPLATHPGLAHWDYIGELREPLAQLGAVVREYGMRVTFHPDHYTLINSLKEEVFMAAVTDLVHHCRLFNTMGLDREAKLITHVGGSYRDKQESLERFVTNWARIPKGIAKRMTLENDDKTFSAGETIYLCEKLQMPMVLDIHHFRCNPGTDKLQDICPRFLATWQGSGLPPKIHVSSPKSNSDPRGHHDFVDPADLYPFLMLVRDLTPNLDVMVEAKQKDRAMLKLVKDLGGYPRIRTVNDAALEII